MIKDELYNRFQNHFLKEIFDKIYNLEMQINIRIVEDQLFDSDYFKNNNKIKITTFIEQNNLV